MASGDNKEEIATWTKVFIPDGEIGDIRQNTNESNEKYEMLLSSFRYSINYYHILGIVFGFIILGIFKKFKWI